MIISERHGEIRPDFERILERTKSLLEVDAQKRKIFYLNISPSELENEVFQKMCETALGTQFENKIKLISGHSFPDIVADIFGVEVKSSKNNNWRSTGNSVLESTRANNINYIYLFFGKVIEPIGFNFRLYQECVYDIAVTHYPRYLIDMNLEKGTTIFDKMKISYDDLRALERPISYIVNYYRSIAKPGEEPWWMETGDPSENIVAPTISLWSKLSPEKQNLYKQEMIVRFPRLFGNSRDKFAGPASYLVAKYGVINPSFRDLFTAGGRISLKVGEVKFIGIPRVYLHLYEDFTEIVELVKNLPLVEAQFYWQQRLLPRQRDLYSLWKNLVLKNSIRDELTKSFLESLFAQCDEKK
jgi:hypothetical protein